MTSGLTSSSAGHGPVSLLLEWHLDGVHPGLPLGHTTQLLFFDQTSWLFDEKLVVQHSPCAVDLDRASRPSGNSEGQVEVGAGPTLQFRANGERLRNHRHILAGGRGHILAGGRGQRPGRVDPTIDHLCQNTEHHGIDAHYRRVYQAGRLGNGGEQGRDPHFQDLPHVTLLQQPPHDPVSLETETCGVQRGDSVALEASSIRRASLRLRAIRA